MDKGASVGPGSREPSPEGLGPSGFDPSRMDDTDWHVLAQDIAAHWSHREEQAVAYQAVAEAIKLLRPHLRAMQSLVWTALKDQRDSTACVANNAKNALEEAIRRGWNSHLPTLEEVQGLFRDSDGSRKGGDAQQGSVEDDSAAIAPPPSGSQEDG